MLHTDHHYRYLLIDHLPTSLDFLTLATLALELTFGAVLTF